MLLVLGTASTNGLFVARLFVPFSVNAALGWVMVGWAVVLLALGSVLAARRRAGIATPAFRFGEWAALTALTTLAAGSGVALTALAPALGW